jgi:hypothetical protein
MARDGAIKIIFSTFRSELIKTGMPLTYIWSTDNSIGIVISLRAERFRDQGSISGRGSSFFLHNVQNDCGAQPASYARIGT